MATRKFPSTSPRCLGQFWLPGSQPTVPPQGLLLSGTGGGIDRAFLTGFVVWQYTKVVNFRRVRASSCDDLCTAAQIVGIVPVPLHLAA
jgi:hypothetical protein